MKKILVAIFWLLFALLGAWAYATLAFKRGEPVNSAYLLIAAVCTYAIGYRFYSKWIALRVLGLDNRRATPCEVRDDGKDFVRTNRFILFGHHFAAIAGPGPLVGPVLAAQFGYLPGALWILIGVVLGGAVQDFVILFCSIRRNGKSLGEMVKEELNSPAGAIAVLAILAILVILLAVLALVVVRALAESPWGVFTVGATIPIALFMGGYMRFLRTGKVLEATAIGVTLLLLAVWGGKMVYQNPHWSQVFGLHDISLAWIIIGYGVISSSLPVWLMLAPRDYLSTFMKLGTILLLAVGILFTLPHLQMPALTQFIDGSGLVVAGKVFPFCFITIACGSISGFHSLIASGTTPKMITRENYARPIGYGAMCFESFVAIMALIAACTLDPGVYLSMNVKGDPAATVAKINALNFPVTVEQMNTLASRPRRKNIVWPHRRRRDAGGGHGAYFFQSRQRTVARSLVSLRRDVRGAVYFDDAGCRHARRAIFAAKRFGPRLATARRSEKSSGRSACRRGDGGRLGLFFDSRRARSARRHQFALAALRHRQPNAGRHRAVSGHDDYSEKGSSVQSPQSPVQSRPASVGVNHFGSSGLAAGSDVHGGRGENLERGSAHRFSGSRKDDDSECVKWNRCDTGFGQERRASLQRFP